MKILQNLDKLFSNNQSSNHQRMRLKIHHYNHNGIPRASITLQIKWITLLYYISRDTVSHNVSRVLNWPALLLNTIEKMLFFVASMIFMKTSLWMWRYDGTQSVTIQFYIGLCLAWTACSTYGANGAKPMQSWEVCTTTWWDSYM